MPSSTGTGSEIQYQALSACASGDLAALDALLSSRTKSSSLTILPDLAISAIENSHPTILERLLADPQTRASLAQIAYSTDRVARAAVAQASPESLRVLLENGLDPNYVLGHSGNLLGHAIRTNRFASVEALLSAGADPRQPFTGYMPVIALAAGAGQKDVVALLMKHGVSLKNSMALHSAARNSNVEMTAWLLDNGADVNDNLIEDECTWAGREEFGSPLHWAAEGRNLEVVELLLEKGADKELKDAKGRTVLERGENDEILKQLLVKA